MKPVVTIHLIDNGYPMCRFHGGRTHTWPLLHISIPRDEYEVNSAACRDPESLLNSLMRYEICKACDHVHLHPPEVADFPVIPSEGRKCERCGITLVPTWPGVYCTTLCAELDA